MVKFIWKRNLLTRFYGTFEMSPRSAKIFGAQGAKKSDPPETPKLKVREVSQIGF